MKELEDKIRTEGEVYPGNILKVGSFLNHQVDVDFLMRMGAEIARLYQADSVTKILTIEASGIAIAVAAASYLHVPLVFAKKGKSKNVSNDVFATDIYSFTHGNVNSVFVSREVLHPGDRILIVDDFLADGNALEGLLRIIAQANATCVGAAIAIEKGFQGGGDRLRAQGLRVESMAIIDAMSDHGVTFRTQNH